MNCKTCKASIRLIEVRCPECNSLVDRHTNLFIISLAIWVLSVISFTITYFILCSILGESINKTIIPYTLITSIVPLYVLTLVLDSKENIRIKGYDKILKAKVRVEKKGGKK